MAHTKSDSLDSTSSSTSTMSASAQASVELYNREIKSGIEPISNSKLSLAELVHAAEKIVNDKFAPNARSTLRHKTNKNAASVSLSQVMLAMLAHAGECGGEEGKHYVATAILACSKQADVIDALEALGTTWVTHLLFIFKCSRAHATQLNQTPSDIATPTRNQTGSHLMGGISSRKPSFDDVKIRDGFTCVITGCQDFNCPDHMISGTQFFKLEGCHILRRAIGKFDLKSKSYDSALTTFDILVNFTRLPFKTLEELDRELDDPSNGITLESNAHYAFDDFRLCLKKTETEHVYNLKIYDQRVGLIHKPENNRVIFVDHSDKCFPPPNRKRNRPINLPNPMYIEIHAAIAGILHMSGAGKFFDELLDKYQGPGSGAPAVDCWSDMETLMEAELLRESVADAFQSIHVR